MRFPDFKVATRNYSVENTAKWRLGDTDDVMYGQRSDAQAG